jgi:hypothetical protein
MFPRSYFPAAYFAPGYWPGPGSAGPGGKPLALRASRRVTRLRASR